MRDDERDSGWNRRGRETDSSNQEKSLLPESQAKCNRYPIPKPQCREGSVVTRVSRFQTGDKLLPKSPRGEGRQPCVEASLPNPLPCRRQTLARCYLPLGQARLRYRWRRRGYGGGDEGGLTLTAGGLSLLGHPQSGPFPPGLPRRASRSAQPLELPPPGLSELFVAVMAYARRRRSGCALHSTRLCCAGAVAPPLPAARPTPARSAVATVAPSAVRRPCWRAPPECQPSAHLPRLRARPPHASPSPRAEPSVPRAPPPLAQHPRPGTVGNG